MDFFCCAFKKFFHMLNFFLHIDHFKITGLITLRKTVENNIGVCIVFAVDCHFSFQEIVCRREEELEDGKVIKTFRTVFIFFFFIFFFFFLFFSS